MKGVKNMSKVYALGALVALSQCHKNRTVYRSFDTRPAWVRANQPPKRVR